MTTLPSATNATQTQKISNLVKLLSGLAEKATTIQESLQKPPISPEDAGVTYRKKVVTTEEELKDGITTRKIVTETTERVDENLRKEQLRQASRSRLPGLVNDFLEKGSIEIDGVKVTQEELLEIQKQLNELGLGDLFRRLVSKGSNNSVIDMDSLFGQNGILNSAIPAADGGVNKADSANSQSQIPPTDKNDEPALTAKTKTTEQTNPPRRGLLELLMSPFSALKRKLGNVVVNQAVSAAQDRVQQASDADIGKAVKQLLASLIDQQKK